MMNVEMGILVTINGRPVWRKAKKLKIEAAGQTSEENYDRVLGVAERELIRLLNIDREAEKAKKEVVTKK